MIACEIYDNDTEELIDNYRLPCKPSIGEILYIAGVVNEVITIIHNIDYNDSGCGIQYKLRIYVKDKG